MNQSSRFHPVKTDRAAFEPRASVALAPLTTLGVGGAARWFVHADVEARIEAAHRWCADRQVPLFVLGGGSNLVVADRGIDGLVLQIGLHGVTFERLGDETRAVAGAGELWDGLVAACVSRGLAGVECLSGIPGTVGGTPIQNVGAYGQEVRGTLEGVTVFDRHDGAWRTLTTAECGLTYRTSRFKGADAGRFVVSRVAFRLRPGPPTTTYADVASALEQRQIAAPTLADVRAAVLAVRRRKGMVVDEADADTRSVGSFFTNPVVPQAHRERISARAGQAAPGYAADGDRVKIPAAWLIEQAGFGRGDRDGRVGVSSRHTLALINCGGASAKDVIAFAARIKRVVADRFAVWLKPEPVFIGLDQDEDVQYLVAPPPEA